jgi:hypothetical protein
MASTDDTKISVELFTKPGVKTSELWVVILAAAAILLPSLLGWVDGFSWGQGVIAGLAALYVAARSWLKLEAMKVVNVIPDELEPQIEQTLDVVGSALENPKKPSAETAPVKQE